MHNSVSNMMFRLFRANETRIHELNYLFWECTTRCNLHCLHCGSDCAAASNDKDMPLDDFLRAFDTIPKSELPQNFTVVLTGGCASYVLPGITTDVTYDPQLVSRGLRAIFEYNREGDDE